MSEGRYTVLPCDEVYDANGAITDRDVAFVIDTQHRSPGHPGVPRVCQTWDLETAKQIAWALNFVDALERVAKPLFDLVLRKVTKLR